MNVLRTTIMTFKINIQFGIHRMIWQGLCRGWELGPEIDTDRNQIESKES